MNHEKTRKKPLRGTHIIWNWKGFDNTLSRPEIPLHPPILQTDPMSIGVQWGFRAPRSINPLLLREPIIIGISKDKSVFVKASEFIICRRKALIKFVFFFQRIKLIKDRLARLNVNLWRWSLWSSPLTNPRSLEFYSNNCLTLYTIFGAQMAVYLPILYFHPRINRKWNAP